MEARHEPESRLETRKLMDLAIDQARLLARAELLHAKLELRRELKDLLLGAAFAGAAFAFLSAGIAALFLAGAFALPLFPWGQALLTAGVLFALAATFGAIAFFRAPKSPLSKTRERLMHDFEKLKEQLH